MAEISRPVVLGVGHELAQVLLEALVVESLESGGIVKVLASGVGVSSLLSEDIGLERIRPPVTVLLALTGSIGDFERALGLGHGDDCCVSVELCIFFLTIRNRSKPQRKDNKGKKKKRRGRLTEH